MAILRCVSCIHWPCYKIFEISKYREITHRDEQLIISETLFPLFSRIFIQSSEAVSTLIMVAFDFSNYNLFHHLSIIYLTADYFQTGNPKHSNHPATFQLTFSPGIIGN